MEWNWYTDFFYSLIVENNIYLYVDTSIIFRGFCFSIAVFGRVHGRDADLLVDSVTTTLFMKY